MRLNQLLEKVDCEFASPYDSSEMVKVFKNPNHAEMSHARNKSSFQELRGLVYNQNVVYVWDANLATHDDVILVLALPQGVFWRFILDAHDVIISADALASQDQILSSHMIQRMIKPLNMPDENTRNQT
jgi:hypothetical protein